jgi:hypothetical protein
MPDDERVSQTGDSLDVIAALRDVCAQRGWTLVHVDNTQQLYS